MHSPIETLRVPLNFSGPIPKTYFKRDTDLTAMESGQRAQQRHGLVRTTTNLDRFRFQGNCFERMR
jgi:hypothetical protein